MLWLAKASSFFCTTLTMMNDQLHALVRESFDELFKILDGTAKTSDLSELSVDNKCFK
jgi:hypothetical protein